VAITKYEKDGNTFWRVYLDLRSRKNPKVRAQKRLNGLTSEREAKAEEKRLVRELSEEISRQELKGISWGALVERWVRHKELYPGKALAKTTLIDSESLLRNWTAKWWERTPSELNRSDGREALQQAKDAGRSVGFCIRMKSIINMVYTWGLEERLIVGAHQSPVFGLEVETDREEKIPEILTALEIRDLLRKAREQNHDWYPIWVGAVFTGCRSGELHQLKKNDIDIIPREQAIAEDEKPFHKRRYGLIRVRRSWNTRFKSVGPTKGGYWRTVPVSSEFYWFLIHDLKIEEKKPENFIFPRHWKWDGGWQAEILRGFCIGNRLPSIKFHTLRACFATQLISTGIPATVIMKICGWKDLKTMQRYIRLAGIDEAGATETLHFIPTEEATMEKVVSLYEHRKKE
jgi:integrase